eukprot:TRINITY_DN3875_c0_g1_i2.p1 TRINITY_DN3875_c0_g1~~TRINITY_DN3875_c0_g1_i2.p1  ORF type:complete len:221 (-),score=36.90 TRINITY_DN3875_c0_g1_i2:102-764(-)
MADQWDFSDDESEPGSIKQLLTKINVIQILRYWTNHLREVQGIEDKIDLLTIGGFLAIEWFQCRESTEDVDIMFPKGFPIALQSALVGKNSLSVQKTAEEFNLIPNWLNAGVQSFWTPPFQIDPTAHILFQYRGVTIYAVDLLYALSQKIGRFSEKDQIDAKAIFNHLEIPINEEYLMFAMKDYLNPQCLPEMDPENHHLRRGQTGEEMVRERIRKLLKM